MPSLGHGGHDIFTNFHDISTDSGPSAQNITAGDPIYGRSHDDTPLLIYLICVLNLIFISIDLALAQFRVHLMGQFFFFLDIWLSHT